MKKKLTHIISIILFATTALLCTTIFGSNTIAQALGWKEGRHSSDSCRLCNGYYSQPKAIADVPNPPNYKTTRITITAKGPITFRTNGVSVLRDDVRVQQPGRLARADKAILHHDKKSGKITDIQLIGHVRVQEAGKLLVGDKAHYNIAKNTLSINRVVYHIAGQHELLTVATPFDAWGTAKSIHRESSGAIHLKKATYSTCSPKDPAWILSAEKMELDWIKGEGTAKNVVIRFKKVPIFYTPYYSFPLNTARKSGFLMPSMGYETNHGFYFSEPYYWNIAPNYDLMITPQWYSARGLQVNGNFRYLTEQSDGFFYASFLPYDNDFAAFKQNTLNIYSTSTATGIQPYISQLRTSSPHRAFIDFENHMEFNQYWSGKFYARYLTDPYYTEDFQTEYLTQNTNQIPSFAELNYQKNHWEDTFLIQSYQTLHPLDQFASPAQNQYMRLPELDFNAAYPQFIPNFDFNLSSQVVRFAYHSDFSPLTYQLPIGNRIHIQPSISRPFEWSSFYITPQLTADNTDYFTKLASAGQGLQRPDFNETRTLPIFDVDSGLYFDRSFQLGGKQYIQTLEPRVFYLYTPYLNQDAYPNFDTQLLPFSTSNLFSLNQFSGFDRLQNANQMTFSLTSNLLHNTDASDLLTAQVGVIDYFKDPRVCLIPGCKTTTGSTSPIAGSLTWNPNKLWSFNSQAAWDTALEQVNNAQVGAQYNLGLHRVIVFNYQFAHGNPDTPFDQFGFSTNSSLITAGLVWPVTLRWHFFGYSYYDLSHRHPLSQYVGLSYDTCCWATRFIVSDNWNGTVKINGGQAFQNQYTTNYYVEFLLKGLGSVANRRAEDMLTSTLPGFADVFSKKGRFGYDQSV